MLVAATAISVADVETSFLPELTVFVLIPVIACTYFLGFGYGFVVAVFAAVSEIVTYFRVGTQGLDAEVTLTTISHMLIYILTAALITRLTVQLRTITNLEDVRSKDLEIAKEVHGSVFKPIPDRYGKLSIGSKVTFARELGGDYCYVAGTDSGLFLCIADISGKSTAAALFTALLKQSVTESLEHTRDISDLVARVNSSVTPTLPEDMFVTMFCAFFDRDEFAYVNAGHTPPLLYIADKGRITTLESSDTLPLGIRPDLRIESSSASFRPGDILLAITDGVIDSGGFGEKPYDLLEEMLLRNATADAQEITDIIFAKAVPAGVTNPPDDAVVVCVKKRDEG